AALVAERSHQRGAAVVADEISHRRPAAAPRAAGPPAAESSSIAASVLSPHRIVMVKWGFAFPKMGLCRSGEGPEMQSRGPRFRPGAGPLLFWFSAPKFLSGRTEDTFCHD